MVLAIKKRYDDGLYRKILGPDRILVPVPGHAPLVKGGLWVPQLLADQMVSVGLGKKVSTSISRIKAVKKSSTARWGERPDVEDHYNTIVLNQGEIFNGNEVTLIDDVITRGCSLYACCALLKKFNPRIHVASFSVFKTKGYTPEIDKFVDPTEGTISYNGWKADRQP